MVTEINKSIEIGNNNTSYFFSFYIKIFSIIISFHLLLRKHWGYWGYWGYRKRRFNGDNFYNVGFGRIAFLSIQKINNRIMLSKEKKRIK